MIRRIASALIVGGLMVPWASAQAPQGPAAKSPHSSPTRPDSRATARRTILRRDAASRPADAHRSINQGRSYSSHGEGGYANPGGVGRYAEYYGPNTPTSQVDQHPVPVARFENGNGGLGRADQMTAYQIGQQRARNIQDSIDAYGRPYGALGAGFGFGYGLAGGPFFGLPN